MAFKLLNRVRVQASGTPGTGAFTLGATVDSFEGFTDGYGLNPKLADGDSTSYLIEDGSPLGTTWEIGVGTYHTGGTVTRDTIIASTNAGTAISATSSAVISGTLLARDVDKTPVLVQGAAVQTNTAGDAVVTLSPPTPGNILIFIGTGGGYQVTTGTYPHYTVVVYEGWTFVGGDSTFEDPSINSRAPIAIHAAMRVVRESDATTTSWTLGNVGTSSGPEGTYYQPFMGMVFEVAGADPTRINAYFSPNWVAGSGAPFEALCPGAGTMLLGFAANVETSCTVSFAEAQNMYGSDGNVANGSVLNGGYAISTSAIATLTPVVTPSWAGFNLAMIIVPGR